MNKIEKCIGLTEEQIALKFLDKYGPRSHTLYYKDAFYKCIFQDNICMNIEYIEQSTPIMELCFHLQEEIKNLQKENKELKAKLPSFNIGDKVYILIDKENKIVKSGTITSIIIEKDKIVYWYDESDSLSQWKFAETSIGKTVFHHPSEIIFKKFKD